MNKVLQALQQPRTITEVADHLGLERHTIAKRLETLRAQGLADYATEGRAKVWHRTNNALLTMLQRDNHLSEEIKNAFRAIGGITVHDKNQNVVFTTTQNTGKKCYEVIYQRQQPCPDCPLTTSNTDKEVTIHSMKNNENQDTGYIEIHG